MTNTTLTLLAAGSLRSAFLPLVAHFRQHTGLAVDAQFGPAGLLRERIEAGSPCAVFASANAAHPQALLQAGLAQECQGFASNQLMLTARRSPDNDGLDWLALLSTTRLRLATSTPGCDPSGDYTWQLFARIEAPSFSSWRRSSRALVRLPLWQRAMVPRPWRTITVIHFPHWRE